MPIAFGVIALVLIVAGVRGKTTDLVTLVKSDFTGQPNYFEWIIAIGLVGAVGYVDELQKISRMFMGLLIMGLLWSNRSVFAQFTSETQQGPLTTPYNNPDATAYTTAFPQFPTMPNAPSAPSSGTLPNFPTMPGYSEIPQTNFPTF